MLSDDATEHQQRLLAIRFGKSFPETMQRYPPILRRPRSKKVPSSVWGMDLLLESNYDRPRTNPRVSKGQKDILLATDTRVDSFQLHGSYVCSFCNSCKGSNAAGYDNETGELVPLFNPRQDPWQDHFAWRGPTLVGKSSVARATIDVLRINKLERVEHRRMLMDLGLLEVTR